MAGLNETPSGERVHIGFFGVRNAGKSSVVNAVTGQDLAVVSDTLGTTTDLVKKAMELLPIGPVVVVDTPGIDDAGDLGQLRVQRAQQALRFCDVAVLVVDATVGIQDADRALLDSFKARHVPALVVWNKADLLDEQARAALVLDGSSVVASAQTKEGIHALKERLGALAQSTEPAKRIVSDLIDEGSMCVLVVPIDESAPKGRIILPQQLVLRDILDTHASCVVCQPEELSGVLASLATPPSIVITDSQVFAQVANVVPETVPLTSFSILMARYKGSLPAFVEGAHVLAQLQDGDKVLIAEGCTHHRQCEDIGTVKIPRMVRAFSGADVDFVFTSGGEFPESLEGLRAIIHCGACMTNEKEMAYRMERAQRSGVPIVNYGMAIAHMNGILERTLRPIINNEAG